MKNNIDFKEGKYFTVSAAPFETICTFKNCFFNTNTLTLSIYAWNMVCPAHLPSVDELRSVEQI